VPCWKNPGYEAHAETLGAACAMHMRTFADLKIFYAGIV
jgi:hypothetical protein